MDCRTLQGSPHERSHTSHLTLGLAHAGRMSHLLRLSIIRCNYVTAPVPRCTRCGIQIQTQKKKERCTAIRFEVRGLHPWRRNKCMACALEGGQADGSGDATRSSRGWEVRIVWVWPRLGLGCWTRRAWNSSTQTVAKSLPRNVLYAELLLCIHDTRESNAWEGGKSVSPFSHAFSIFMRILSENPLSDWL